MAEKTQRKAKSFCQETEFGRSEEVYASVCLDISFPFLQGLRGKRTPGKSTFMKKGGWEEKEG